jgi:HAMP domain-containing protein
VAAVSELDRVKQQITYLTLALVAIFALSLGILDLHRRIERRIERLGDL